MHSAHLDDDEWAPPPSPLTPDLIQRGKMPVFPVGNERATDPLTPELAHWSALPALSYFALNAVALREAARRVRSPTSFRPPPRVTLSELRSHYWLVDLCNPRIPLRRLGRTVPHGYSGSKLLTTLLEMRPPVGRAVWFVRCVGASEVRALKRKAGLNDSDRNEPIERSWLAQWTQAVETLLNEVVDSYKNERSDSDEELFGERDGQTASASWTSRIHYASNLLMGLYNESLLDRQALLDWVLVQLRTSGVHRLPCFVHFVQLLWAPFTSAFMAPHLLRSVAVRLVQDSHEDQDVHAVLTKILEPIIFKLVSTNDNAFVTPRTWPLIEPYVRSHPAYQRLVERNSAFMTTNLHDTSNWSNLLAVGRLMAMFARPYHIQELVSALESLDISSSLLVKTVLSRIVRWKTTAGNLLGLNLLKRLRILHPNTDFPNLAVDFLLETDPGRASPQLSALICDLVSAKMFNLGRYLNRLIAQDLLFPGEPARNMHLDVLTSLPDTLTASDRTQVAMMLRKSGIRSQVPDLDAIISRAFQKAGINPALSKEVDNLHLQHRRRLAEGLVTAFLQRDHWEDLPLTAFGNLVDRASVGTMRPLARLLCTAISTASPLGLGALLHQVHIRLMALVSAGFVDTFARQFVARIDELHDNFDEWISVDDASVLRSVIQDPGLMFDFNRVLPMRPPTPVALNPEHTPVEHDLARTLLHRHIPDITQILALRGTDGMVDEIVEYSRLPNSDRLTLLQLVTYAAVDLADLLPPHSFMQPGGFDVDLVRSLLLTPPNEIGFDYGEYEALRRCRHEFLQLLNPDEYLRLSAALDSFRFSSTVAHFFPDVFETKVVQPAISSPQFRADIKQSFGELQSFERLLVTGTPFNLRFRQGLITLKYHGCEPETVAKEVLAAAYAHPERSDALQGLLHTVSVEAKQLIFTKTVRLFLSEGLTPEFLARIDVPFNLVGALAASVHAPLHWDFHEISEFLQKLVSLVDKPSNDPEFSRDALCRALVLVLRISVVGRLSNLALPTSVVPYLDRLLHVEMFADDHHMRTVIEDALRLVLRISQPEESRHLGGGLEAGGGVTDGLQLYSKSSDEYSPLPVWAFDLIEDVSSCQGNDAPVDLALFEAYRD